MRKSAACSEVQLSNDLRRALHDKADNQFSNLEAEDGCGQDSGCSWEDIQLFIAGMMARNMDFYSRKKSLAEAAPFQYPWNQSCLKRA